MKSCKCIAENYLSLPRSTSKSKVVVSMFLKNMDLQRNLTLKSILDQTVHPDQIIIVTNEAVNIPDFLKKDSIVVAQKAGQYGASGAFMIPLQTQKDSETKIIIVTDGVVYGADFIETILENSDDDAIVFVEGYSGSSYANGKLAYVKNGNISQDTVINMRGGVLVKPKMFNRFVIPESTVVCDAPDVTFTANPRNDDYKLKQITYGESFHTAPEINQTTKTALAFYAQYFAL